MTEINTAYSRQQRTQEAYKQLIEAVLFPSEELRKKCLSKASKLLEGDLTPSSRLALELLLRTT